MLSVQLMNHQYQALLVRLSNCRMPDGQGLVISSSVVDTPEQVVPQVVPRLGDLPGEPH